MIDLFSAFPNDNTVSCASISRGKGVNSKNQVVGWYRSPSHGNRPFIWLPEPDYDLPRGFHNLNDILNDFFHPDPGIPDAVSEARAINDHGVVSGVVDGHAFIWDLSGGQSGYACFIIVSSDEYPYASPCTVVYVDDLLCNIEGVCAANDINNGDPATVVGYLRIKLDCMEENSPSSRLIAHPFAMELTSTPQVEILPSGSAVMAHQSAYGINPTATLTRRITGTETFYPAYWGSGGGLPGCGTGVPPAQCEPPDYLGQGAMAWTGTNPPQPTQLEILEPPDQKLNHIGLGVNDDGNIAGLGELCLDPEVWGSLRHRAVLWASPSASPTILPMFQGSEDDDWQANALTNELTDGELFIVGRNITTRDAIMWHREDTNAAWSVSDINDFIVGPCGDNGWILRDAADITDDLAITGWGIINGIDLDRAFLLVLDGHTSSCPADLNCDYCVDGADFGQLLAAWGPCPDCEDCPADLTGDCEVDGNDLGQLLAAWGRCPGFEESCVPSFDCDPGDAPDEQTILAAEQGDFMPVFLWLIDEGHDKLAIKLLEATGTQQ